ncbi:methyltransferase [Candidatus Woesearchaeota archaeon]|nr:methyltransferase [Candidatus Woesearchaeota archaeon]
MVSCKSVYEPREDSTMLEKYVRQCAEGKVLDVGTGSGIQAIAAAQNKDVTSVLATDVQKGVIEYCRKCIKNKKIKFIQSDLFKNVKGKFDVIVFNPPYLPQELKLKDLTLEGGKKGYEVIERFLNEANEFLKTNGIILLVFSSLTRKEKVEELIKNNLLDFEELEKQRIFFEDIYVYLLRKNGLLKKLENKKISSIKYFAKGHRGFLFTGRYKNKKIAIKVKNPKSEAFGRIENEAKWLKRLNKNRIGPKLLFFDKDYFAYEFIEGDFILDFIKKSNKIKVKKIIKNTFSRLFIMDKLKIDKEEMHRPVKHIIVCKDSPHFIDFERCHYSQYPKNITQFCQFMMSVEKILKNKGITIKKPELMELAKVYKNNPSKSNLKRIMGMI